MVICGKWRSTRASRRFDRFDMRVAFGLKARTGRAILVAVGADGAGTAVVERAQLPLLPAGAFAPYHAAEGLEPEQARASVQRDIDAAHRLAASGIRDAARRIASAGHELRGCAVLVGPGMPPWTTEQIIAVHVRMHQAEGALFRDVLVAGAKTCALALTTLPEKSALDSAAQTLGVTRERLEARLAALGKSAGPPWAKDHKEAAAAALVALEHGARAA
jgi:hypothetical protein